MDSIILTTLPQKVSTDGIDLGYNTTHSANQLSLLSVRQKLPGGGEADFDTPIDSAMDDFTVSVSGPNVNLTILNPKSRSSIFY